MDSSCVAAPGAFNALVARAIRDAGFNAMYISGAATTVSAGVPDIGLLTLDHFAKTIRESYDACGLPILADADTGFGEAEMVRRTVLDYSRAGAAGLHLEDQKFPKRCGHLDGKELIPTDHMIEKVQWAAQARDELGNGFIICARTDARGVDGMEAAINRAAAYVRAGADMIFPEGLTNEAEFKQFAQAMQGVTCASRGANASRGPYLLANMTEFGKTAHISAAQFGAMGYSIVIYPLSVMRMAMKAVEDGLAHLKTHGSMEAMLPRMQHRSELYGLLGYRPGEQWDFPGE